MKRRAADNIFLIGPMGSGKSTVGRALAKRLGWTFVDTDRIIERTAGADISRIFEQNGEPFFRKLEEKAVRRASQRRERVISIGGGAVLSLANRRVIARRGVAVYLQVSAATAFRRASVQGLEKRPLLGRQPEWKGLRVMRRLMTQRRPHYLRCADFSVRAESGPVIVAERILRRLAELFDGEAGGE